MKNNANRPENHPASVEYLIQSEHDAVRRRDWRAATNAARERAALIEARYRPRTRRTR